MEFIDFDAIREALGPFKFLASREFWSDFYYLARQILIVVSAALFVFSVWLIFKIWPLKLHLYVHEGRRAYKAPKKQADFEEEQKRIRRRKWDEIIKKAEAIGLTGYSLSIIDADILIEDTMGRMGFLGKNLAERLRSAAPGELPSTDEIWEAHKLRNRIAHEPGFRPSKEETMKALSAYKKALEDLQAI